MKHCIFCKIVNHDISTDLIRKSENVIAFNDINPKAPVHILIIPKKHIESIATMTSEEGSILVEMTEMAKDIAIEKRLNYGYRLVFNIGPDSGAEVPHLHMHLIGGTKLKSMA